jgi:hypothetical protein
MGSTEFPIPFLGAMGLARPLLVTLSWMKVAIGLVVSSIVRLGFHREYAYQPISGLQKKTRRSLPWSLLRSSGSDSDRLYSFTRL